jgi:DNA modification methylase
MTNTLYYGDNLDILKRYIQDESIDLVYLDPPFKSNQNYNLLFKEKDGTDAASQIRAFEDTWHWDQEDETMFADLVLKGGRLAKCLEAFRTFLGTCDLLAYLVMMAPRLVELYRVMKPTASIYLHCDPAASHYLKLLMDAIWGVELFQNEITWKRTSSHNDPQRFGRICDRILFYAKSKEKFFQRRSGDYSVDQLARYKFTDEKGPFRAENLTAPHYSQTRSFVWRGTHPGENRQWRYSVEELERLFSEGRILLRKDGSPRKDGLKEYLKEAEGQPLQDLWSDIVLGPTAGERLGYPTQKPLALLDRIIQSSSIEGDLILDPFCGCGTTVVAAQKLNRRWIGIDITHLAVTLIKQRLADSFMEQAIFQVIGEPVALPDAERLANQDPYQFQWWSLGLVGARPVERKKGADKGIDGKITFQGDLPGKFEHVVISVKSGHLSAIHIRDLKAVVDREKSAIGILISLQTPTRQMREEAIVSGFYHSEMWGKNYPKIQLLTIKELLDGKCIDMPPIKMTNLTFRKSPRVNKTGKDDLSKTGSLLS